MNIVSWLFGIAAICGAFAFISLLLGKLSVIKSQLAQTLWTIGMGAWGLFILIGAISFIVNCKAVFEGKI